jgi:hypothetical protein
LWLWSDGFFASVILAHAHVAIVRRVRKRDLAYYALFAGKTVPTDTNLATGKGRSAAKPLRIVELPLVAGLSWFASAALKTLRIAIERTGRAILTQVSVADLITALSAVDIAALGVLPVYRITYLVATDATILRTALLAIFLVVVGIAVSVAAVTETLPYSVPRRTTVLTAGGVKQWTLIDIGRAISLALG